MNTIKSFLFLLLLIPIFPILGMEHRDVESGVPWYEAFELRETGSFEPTENLTVLWPMKACPKSRELLSFEKEILYKELGLNDSVPSDTGVQAESRLLETGNELHRKLVAAIKKYKIRLLDNALRENLFPQDKIPEYRALIDKMQHEKGYESVSRFMTLARAMMGIFFTGVPVSLALYNLVIKKAYDAMISCAKIANVSWEPSSNAPELLIFLMGICIWLTVNGNLFYDQHLDQDEQYYGLEHIKFVLGVLGKQWTPIKLHLSDGIDINRERLQANLLKFERSLKDLDHKKFKRIASQLSREEVLELVVPCKEAGAMASNPLKRLPYLIFENFEDDRCKLCKCDTKSFFINIIPIVFGIALFVATIWQGNNFYAQLDAINEILDELANKGVTNGSFCVTENQEAIYPSDASLPVYGSFLLMLFIPYFLVKKNCRSPLTDSAEHHRESSIKGEYNKLLEGLKESH